MKRVRNKILAGYLVVLILMMVGGALVLQKLSEFTDRVDHLSNTLSHKLTYSKDIATHTALTRVYAEAYLVGGSTSDLNEFNRHKKQLEKDIQILEDKTDHPRELAHIDLIRTAVKNYSKAFSEVVALMERRQKIIFGDLNMNKFKTGNKLSALRVAVSTKTDLKAFLSFGNAQNDFLRMLLHTSEYIQNGDERFGVLCDKAFKNALKAFQELEALFVDPGDRHNAREAQTSLEKYHESFNEIRRDLRRQNTLVHTIFTTLEPVIGETVARLVADIDQQYQDHNSQSKAILVETRTHLAAFTVISFFLGVFLAFTLSRKITDPLYQVMKTSKQIAEEDLQVLTDQLNSLAGGDVRLKFTVKSLPLPVGSEDEVGETSRTFNQIIYQLREAEKAFLSMSAYLNEMAQTAQAVSNGDLSVQVNKKSDHDILGKALAIMTQNLAGSKAEVARYQDHLEELVQKKTEALGQSEEKLTAILQANPVPILVIDVQGHPQYMNPSFTELFGWSLEELPDHALSFIREYPKASDLPITRKEKDHGGMDRIETKCLTKQGRTIDVLVSSAPIKSTGSTASGMVVCLTDLSKTRELEEQVRQAHKMEAIGTLAGGIAHEFNNMLAIIIGNADMALFDIPEGNMAAECIEEIQTASQRAKEMVQKLISFSRKTPESRRPVQITPLLTETVMNLEKNLPPSIDIRTHMLCPSGTVLADPRDITQVVMNLCTNSVQAMGKGPGILEIDLDSITLDHLSPDPFKELAPGAYARLKIQDTGTGIEPDIMARMWEPYFTTKEVDGVMGMGLSVVHGIVKKYKGGIHVQSDPEKGTCVEVVFPLMDAIPGTDD